MDLIERVSHPSAAQVETLVSFLEERPNLAKGFIRNPNAKARAFKEWEKITTILNSSGGGAIKCSKKWMKDNVNVENLDNLERNMATNPFPQHREPSPEQIREPEPPPTVRHRDNPSANFTPRRHTFQTLRGSPPSQRRSQFNSMAEKFLKLEEQRLSYEGRVVKVMEEMAQTHNVLAEGVKALGEGLKAMGEGLRLLAESL